MCDFNIDLLNKSHCDATIKLLTMPGLMQSVQFPTHQNGSLLDHIFTNISASALTV